MRRSLAVLTVLAFAVPAASAQATAHGTTPPPDDLPCQITWDGTSYYDGKPLIHGPENSDAVICGTEKADVILGRDGHDVIRGEGGDDLIYGSTGNDNISGTGGNDTIFGGDGDDVLRGDDGDDQIYGEAGNDAIAGNAGSDNVFGQDGMDRVAGGGFGHSTLDGYKDTVKCGADADIYVPTLRPFEIQRIALPGSEKSECETSQIGSFELTPEMKRKLLLAVGATVVVGGVVVATATVATVAAIACMPGLAVAAGVTGATVVGVVVVGATVTIIAKHKGDFSDDLPKTAVQPVAAVKPVAAPKFPKLSAALAR